MSTEEADDQVPEGSVAINVLKVIIIGPPMAGKTAIIKRYVHQNFFSEGYKATTGVDFSKKIVKWKDDAHVEVCIWDIGGQDKFASHMPMFFRNSHGAVIVFDSTSEKSLAETDYWRNLLKDACPNIPILLLANKCDLAPRCFTESSIEQIVEAQGYTGWYSTSAKEGTNLDVAFKFMVGKMMDNPTSVPVKRVGIVAPTPAPPPPKTTCC
eukprot:TRINITY_DN4449_c1_g1_i1.p1 TRINITY_DN4449_c1_g1~~TRINITY_DN4449_c1_g1_i1.p1  ORF type:complete len:234 (-),score=102.97 TRINITY_DN4449_c1_g1_i1:192-824(-)